MINPKKLIQLARKWQKVAVMRRRRISFPRSSAPPNSSVANKGHFIVYTNDNSRFPVPLEYLSRNIFVELLRLAEEEFGLPSDGPITLPCDSTFLKYVMSLVKVSMSMGLEKALLTYVSKLHFSASSSLAQGQSHHQFVCSY